MEQLHPFEISTMNQYRYATGVTSGGVSEVATEDLWSLALKSSSDKQPDLNGIARIIHNELKDCEDVLDFVGDTDVDNSAKRSELEIKMQVVRRVIDYKNELKVQKQTAAANAAHNAKIDALIEKQKNKDMESLSVDELQALKK